MQVVPREASRPVGEATLRLPVKWGRGCARFIVCACVHAHYYLLFPCMPGELYSWACGRTCLEDERHPRILEVKLNHCALADELGYRKQGPQLLPFLLSFRPGGFRAFSVSTLQAVAGTAGQGSSPFSFLGSLVKEQTSGCFLPVTLPALCMALLVLVFSPGGLEDMIPSMSSGGVELPKQDLGALFQGELESPFDCSYSLSSQSICCGGFGPQRFSD